MPMRTAVPLKRGYLGFHVSLGGLGSEVVRVQAYNTNYRICRANVGSGMIKWFGIEQTFAPHAGIKHGTE